MRVGRGLHPATRTHDTPSSALEVKGSGGVMGIPGTTDNTLTIGAVAARSGLRHSALRYYESAGLLPPPVRVGGQRRYDAGVLDRLAVIKLAREAGFTIAETRTFLHGFAPDTPPPDRWRALAATKLPAVDALIARALGMKRILEAGLRCECVALEDCASAVDAAGDGNADEAAPWTG